MEKYTFTATRDFPTINTLENFIHEVQEHLKKKLNPIPEHDGKTHWTCGYEHAHYDDDRYWRHFDRYCSKKKLDPEKMRKMIEQYAGEGFFCQCNLVNHVHLKGTGC